MYKVAALIAVTILVLSVCLGGYEIEMSQGKLIISGEPGELSITELSLGSGRFAEISISGFQKGSALGEPDLPHYSRLAALPEQGNWSVNKFTYDVKEIDIPYSVVPSGWEDLSEIAGYRGEDWYPSELVTISDPSIMRNYRFSQVTIAAVQYNAVLQKIRILSNIHLELSIDESISSNPWAGREMPGSASFDRLAQDLIFGIDNYRNAHDSAGSLLIICRPNVQSYLENLSEWKQKLGYHTSIATTANTGSTNNSIKNYIQNAYDTWEYPPDHVLLVGDVTGSYSLPAFYCEGYMYPTAVTDHNYALLSGTDYFPDVLVGRISIQSTTHLSTAISKIINYEGNPYMTNTNWYNKALMMSVVNDQWGQEYYSGRETVIEAGNKLLDFTYTQVDTFIAPYQSSATQLRNLINTGYTFLNYRGFGSTYYWTGANGGHMFEISDINSLSNGWMLPMVTSIVCGGADFASSYTTCFGETWVVSGSSSNPRGGIAFIGPSEHDTKTPFNNCNDLGIYQGITQEGIYGTSAMMLRGKMEMYNNYPYCHAWGDATNSDQFYFYVYILLGDPSVQIWTDVPKSCELTTATEIPEGQNYVEVSISSEDNELEGFMITVTSDSGLLATGLTNSLGSAYIPVMMPLGDYAVTASRYGYIPNSESIEVISGDNLGIEDYSTSITPTAGEDFELQLLLRNYGTTASSNIDVEIYNYDGYFDVINNQASQGYLAGGAAATLSFELSAGQHWINGRNGIIFCNINSSSGFFTGLIELEIQSAEMIVSNIEIDVPGGYLGQGMLCPLYLELYNCGEVSGGNLSTVLYSLNSNAIVSENVSEYGDIAPGTSGTNATAFEVLAADVISGQVASLQLSIYRGNEIVQVIPVTIPVGEIGETDPTFDTYGYMAIESSDIGNFEVPEYEWLDISPFAGGEGTYLTAPFMHETTDGWIDQIDLPFSFQYYGEEFDRITVCQNGYFSFGEANTLFFRNKSLPSGYGPGGMVCPFWDDLEQGYVYYWYDEDNHRFMIEWKNMRSVYSPGQRQYFQVVLRDPAHYPTATGDGEIIFIYQQVNNVDQSDNYASVGIESPDKTMGLEISFANFYATTAHTLSDETAILFTPVQPAAGGILYGDVDANGAVEAFDASLALQYFVGIDPGAVAPLPWPQWRIERADVDGNGVVEAYDGSLILQYFVGIISEFPVENTRRR
jgi:hypothetical protein